MYCNFIRKVGKKFPFELKAFEINFGFFKMYFERKAHPTKFDS